MFNFETVLLIGILNLLIMTSQCKPIESEPYFDEEISDETLPPVAEASTDSSYDESFTSTESEPLIDKEDGNISSTINEFITTLSESMSSIDKRQSPSSSRANSPPDAGYESTSSANKHTKLFSLTSENSETDTDDEPTPPTSKHHSTTKKSPTPHKKKTTSVARRRPRTKRPKNLGLRGKISTLLDARGAKLNDERESVLITEDTLAEDSSIFLTETGWEEDSFYPQRSPHLQTTEKPRTVASVLPMLTWTELLVMLKPKKVKTAPKYAEGTTKSNLQDLLESVMKRSRKIEMELKKLERKLDKKTSSEVHSTTERSTTIYSTDKLESSSQTTAEPSTTLYSTHKLESSSQSSTESSTTLYSTQKLEPSSQSSTEPSRTLYSTQKLESSSQTTTYSPLSQEVNIKIEAEAPLHIKANVGPPKEDVASITILPREMHNDLIGADVNKSPASSIPDPTDTMDPLELEKREFIRKGAEFLRHAWDLYKFKRHPNLG